MQAFICALETGNVRGGSTGILYGSDTFISCSIYLYIGVISLLDAKLLEGKT